MAIVDNPWTIALALLAGLLTVSMLSKIASGVKNPVARETINQSGIILRSANRWALMAKQDTNAVMALMHICYAKAYVSSLRRILSDEQINRAHQVDMCDLEQKMDKIEQESLAQIAQQAPHLMPEGEFAVRTGWLG
jgi:hypothetical protein